MDTDLRRRRTHAFDGSTCHILIGRTLALIANKWAVPIIMALGRARGPVRFTELARAIPFITQKELTKQLRELETAGLVGRKVFAVVPPRVEYWLTETGTSLEPVLDTLASWAAENGTALEKSRAAHSERKSSAA